MIQPRVFQITGSQLSINLPSGYWAFQNVAFVDAWVGTIANIDGGLEIRYSAGTVQKPDLSDKEKFLWTKTRSIDGHDLVYALEQRNVQQWIYARFQSINFASKIRSNLDIETFLAIVSTTKDEPCVSCMRDYSARRRFLVLAQQAGYKNERIEEISKISDY